MVDGAIELADAGRNGVARGGLVRLRATTSWPVGRGPVLAGVGLLVVCLLVVQARDLLSFSRHYTDEDQTLLWLAGRDLFHGKLFTPNFWGQNYNTIFEALPGAVLQALGMSVALASPLGAACLATACWLIVAAAAWRTDRLSAAIALALPVCLSVPYLVGFSQLAGRLTGDLAGALAVASAVAVTLPRRRLALVIAFGGLAVLWDNTNILDVVPALVLAVGEDWRVLISRAGARRTTAAIVLGALPPLAWFVYQNLWYHFNPGYVIDPSVTSSLDPSVLWANLKQPETLLAAYAPQLLSRPRLVEVLLLALDLIATGVTLRRRRILPVLVALVFTLTLLAVLSVNETDSNSFGEVYLSGARFLFPLPMAAWLVSHTSLRAWRSAASSSSEATQFWRRPVAVVVIVVAIASTISQQLTFRNQMAPLISFSQSAQSPVTVEDPTQLLASCAQVTALYHKTDAEVLVTVDRTFGYGCAAATNINTLYPVYDRRVWVLRSIQVKSVRRVLLQGYSCKPGTSRVGTCVQLPDGLEEIMTPARPLVDTLSMLGVAVRDA